MEKEFYYYDRKYRINEYGKIDRLAYDDIRPHKYGNNIIMLHRHNKAKNLKNLYR